MADSTPYPITKQGEPENLAYPYQHLLLLIVHNQQKQLKQGFIK